MPGRQLVVSYLCFFALPAIAEMYTWTDPQGVTHFSDRAPTSQVSEPVVLGTSSVIPMAGNIRQSQRVSAIRKRVQRSLQQRQTRNASAGDGGKEISAKEKQCHSLRARLEKIQRQLRAGYANDRGNSLRQKRRELSQRHSWECLLD